MMKTLTKAIPKRLPPLGATEDQEEPVAQVESFALWSSWTWFDVEYDRRGRVVFGLALGFEAEAGCFSLEPSENVRGPGGLRIERDLYFKPKPLSECRKESGEERCFLT